MGQFLNRVQSGEIVGPLRKGFTSIGWTKAFETSNSPDKHDQEVHDAAIVIHQKLENIRSRLKFSSSALTPTTKLRAFVAVVNNNFLTMKTKTLDAIEKVAALRNNDQQNPLRLEELLAEVKIELPGGFNWSPDEVVQSLVDGIEIPVRISLNGAPSLAGNPRMSEVEWPEVALELNLGIMYRFAEDIWDDCLWNNYKLVDRGSYKFFIPQDIDTMKGFAIGIARRNSLSMGYSIMATKFHRAMANNGALFRICDIRAIAQQGKRQVIRVSKTSAYTEAMEELLVLRGYANEPYYTDLLEENLPKLEGLTLSEVLNAWVVISRTALLLVDSLGASSQNHLQKNISTKNWLPKYAPVLQVEALVDALSAAAGIKFDKARKLIEFFTFRGQPGQEIWASPLVPVGLTTVAPVFAAVASPNLRRLIDVWMRQAGVDLGKRGPAFEGHIRSNTIQSIRSSSILKDHCFCIPYDYTFKPKNGRAEQIDLLFVIGSNVFLAEVKCILEPTESKGIATHRKTVLHAAEQALRKSRSILENSEDFVMDIKKFGINLSTNFKATPLVILSTSTHVGTPALGVPVIDAFILERFLIGELEHVSVTGKDLNFQNSEKTVFYRNLIEAEANATQYFHKPPQMQRLIRGVNPRVAPIHPINEYDWSGLIVNFQCNPTN